VNVRPVVAAIGVPAVDHDRVDIIDAVSPDFLGDVRGEVKGGGKGKVGLDLDPLGLLEVKPKAEKREREDGREGLDFRLSLRIHTRVATVAEVLVLPLQGFRGGDAPEALLEVAKATHHNRNVHKTLETRSFVCKVVSSQQAKKREAKRRRRREGLLPH